MSRAGACEGGAAGDRWDRTEPRNRATTGPTPENVGARTVP